MNLYDVVVEYAKGNHSVLEEDGVLFKLGKRYVKNPNGKGKYLKTWYEYKDKRIANMEKGIRIKFALLEEDEFTGSFYRFLFSFLTSATMATGFSKIEDNRKLYSLENIDEQVKEYFARLAKNRNARFDENKEITNVDRDRFLMNVLYRNMIRKFELIVQSKYGRIIRKGDTDRDERELFFESIDIQIVDEKGKVHDVGMYRPSMFVYNDVRKFSDIQNFMTAVDLTKFLNEKQKRVYPLYVEKVATYNNYNPDSRTFNKYDKLTDDDIVDALNREDIALGLDQKGIYEPWTKRKVNYNIKRIGEILVNQFMAWKNQQQIHKVPTSEKIRSYIDRYEAIEDVTGDYCVLFSLLIDFLSQNYIFKEEVIEKSEYHHNLSDSKDSVFDVVTDNLSSFLTVNDVVGNETSRRYYSIVLSILHGEMTVNDVSAQDKKRITNQVTKLLSKWLIEFDRETEKAMLAHKK